MIRPSANLVESTPLAPKRAMALSWLLPLALTLVAVGLGWLMFGIAGYRDGMLNFPTDDGALMEYQVEAGQRRSVAEVMASPEEAWEEWRGSYLHVQPGEALWIRVKLVNPGREPIAGVLADSEYLPDRIEAWIAGGDGEWKRSASGEAFRGGDKPLWSRTAAFPVHLAPAESATVYLRVTDYYPATPWLRWWPKGSDFFQAQLRDILAEAVCYGIVLALVIYNFVLWVRLRFPDTGCYVLYAGAMLAFNFISNGGLALLGIAAPSPMKEMLTGGTLALSGLFFVQFARTFLGTAATLPRADRALRLLVLLLLALLAGVGAMLIPGGLGAKWFDVILVGVALSHLLLLIVGVVSWYRGVRHARTFLAAFGLLFTGGVPALITWLSGDAQAWAAMMLLGASSMEMLLLSFAVADRFGQTQRQLLEETEQRRMLQESYADELKFEVGERTRELAQAVEDKDRMLSVIGHDLRSPLTGLVRTADEGSSRFAGEVAKTGRALLLMIEDLVLWTHLHAGGRVTLLDCAMQEIAAPAMALHRVVADYRQIRLICEVPEALRVRTDPVLAQTLVRNLISNAVKWAREEVVLRVEVVENGEDGEDGEARLTLANDGPPLSEELLHCIQNNKRDAILAGKMGLRLCMDISALLGARLTVRNRSEGGVEVGFVFPLAEKAMMELPVSL